MDAKPSELISNSTGLQAAQRNCRSSGVVTGNTKREELTKNAGVVSLARDVSASINPTSVVEEMLADQLAACHNAGMNLITQASLAPNSQEMIRLVNGSARMFEVFQQ